jgi:cell division protein ZapA (FtsZ GTPase activity inhibitor)
MWQVSEQVGSGDALRVAVLAALNIADDYYQARRAFELREREVERQARALAEKLRDAIEPVLDRRRQP